MHSFKTPKPDPKHITPEDKDYKGFIRLKPCCVCVRPSIAHHEQISGRGIGIKASDYEILPLCFSTPGFEGCHERRHRIGKYTFWAEHFELPEYLDDFTKECLIDFCLAKMIIGYLIEYITRQK